jgi:hypothetical protein
VSTYTTTARSRLRNTQAAHVHLPRLGQHASPLQVTSRADKGKGRYDEKRPNLAQFVVEFLELYILLA